MLGLRVDVDSRMGARIGAPMVAQALAEQGLSASFFFSVGPDSMGRHRRRPARRGTPAGVRGAGRGGLFRFPSFREMAWPGPAIGKSAGEAIRAVALAGHEIGLLGWDPLKWRTRRGQMARTRSTGTCPGAST